MDPSAANEDLVRSFCLAFARRDIEEILGFFADDAVYHNIPLAPASGKDAIRATLETFVPGSPEIEFVLLNMASSGSVVFTERIDRMTFGGNPVELPVAGVFEIEAGKITAWRDYFDLQQFLNPSTA
ncbi:MAG TPA: limonene-1,2-epoxide hydrolase family protein [Acidimicrobiales bacterium]|nr:limonene-1,2-epoxide hydrolase family protein [Acidimicrobiales bacterium]